MRCGITREYLTRDLLRGRRPMGESTYLRIARVLWPTLTDGQRLAKLDGDPIKSASRSVLLHAIDSSGLSRAEFARRCRMSPAYLADVLKGRRYIGQVTYLRIAREVWPTLTDAQRLAKRDNQAQQDRNVCAESRIKEII